MLALPGPIGVGSMPILAVDWSPHRWRSISPPRAPRPRPRERMGHSYPQLLSRPCRSSVPRPSPFSLARSCIGMPSGSTSPMLGLRRYAWTEVSHINAG